MAVTEAEFETAYTSGDTITYTPNDPSTAANEEKVALTNAELTGRLADIQVASDRYDVTNLQGNQLEDDFNYVTGTNLYSRNGTAINLAEFETLLGKIAADATPDDTITVDRTSTPGTSKHNLTTDETLP